MNYKSRKLRPIKLLLVGIICGLPTMILFAPPMTYTVSNTNETGAGSLNAAITMSNGNNPGTGNRNTINFSAGGVGVINITTTELPHITQPVLIDGTSAPGWGVNANFAQSGPNTATLVIQINGPGALFSTTAPFNGLTLDAGSDGSIIQGLSITNFAVVQGLDTFGNPIGGSGIRVLSNNNTILGCFIGADLNGALGANYVAIFTTGNGTIIGDGTKFGRNLIAGTYNVAGTVQDSGNNTTILGNTVGLDKSGTIALMRDATLGIYCVSATGAFPAPSGAIYGGLNPGQGNVVAGNSRANIVMRGTNALIQGNYVGVGTDGIRIFAVNPNGRGIHVHNDFIIAIPSCITIDSNTISGNTYGITVGGNNFNTLPVFAAAITANFIGTDPTGTFAIPNELDGIWVQFGQGTCIGGNTISANGRHGIRLCKTQFTNIKSNWIGTNISGANLGNGGDGVRLGSLGVGVQSFGDVVGGAKGFGQPFPTSLTNFIQFNKGNGIKTQGFVQHASIVGNIITNNGENGILLGKGATHNFVGGFNSPGSLRIIGGLISQGNTSIPTPLGTGNIIQNNGLDGIKEFEANANTIQDNIISLNTDNGIELVNSSDTLVGIPDAGNSVIPQVLGNVVTDNGGAGVAVVQTDCKKAKDNAILSNSIVNNAKDGIEFVKQ